jgi:hypothetical protein
MWCVDLIRSQRLQNLSSVNLHLSVAVVMFSVADWWEMCYLGLVTSQLQRYKSHITQ